MKNDLALKYRPKSYDEFVGNKKIVDELKKRTFDQNFPKSVLFIGQTGCGKTSLERIYAKSLLCSSQTEKGFPCNICDYCKVVDKEQTTDYITFYNGGEFGVDQVNQLIDKTERKLLGRKGLKKVFVIDEFQSIKSKVAEENLLKVLEKEHDNCYFIFGAMRWDGISKAIKGRVKNATYKLSLNYDEIRDRLIEIVKKEEVEVTKSFAELVITISDNCNNSLRDAIGLLESIIYRNIKTEKELFDNFDILSKDSTDEIIRNILIGDIQALRYGINEELYKQINHKLSYLYRYKSGLELNSWQKNQIKDIVNDHLNLEVIENTVNKLNELLKYRYLTDILIENHIIGIVNSNKGNKGGTIDYKREIIVEGKPTGRVKRGSRG